MIQPDEIIKKYGADILRLWVSLKTTVMTYGFLRRSLNGFLRLTGASGIHAGSFWAFSRISTREHMLPVNEMRQLDRFALYRLNGVISRIRKAYDDFEFHVVFHTLYNYCTVDLSSLYLDIIKDRLYVEKTDGKLRRSAQSAL